MHRLSRALVARSHKSMDIDEGSDQNLDLLLGWMRQVGRSLNSSVNLR